MPRTGSGGALEEKRLVPLKEGNKKGKIVKSRPVDVMNSYKKEYLGDEARRVGA
jgi:hypothetical protein